MPAFFEFSPVTQRAFIDMPSGGVRKPSSVRILDRKTRHQNHHQAPGVDLQESDNEIVEEDDAPEGEEGVSVTSVVEGKKRTERFSEKSLNLENSLKSEVRLPSSSETLQLRE